VTSRKPPGVFAICEVRKFIFWSAARKRLEKTGLQKAFTIRRFVQSDLEEVMNINRICLPENYAPYFFVGLHEKFPATFVVAEVDNTVVGYIMCRIETSSKGFGLLGLIKKGHIVSIAVLPEYQRKGIGTALILEAARNLSLYRAQECFLEVRVSNLTAVNMYKQLRFRILRRMRRYYADGEDAYVMGKELQRKSQDN
jgi:ribosomal-protein-alanine N-acetyltransferase